MARTVCICPGCRRTTAEPFDEWICAKHWRAVPKHLRKRLHMIRRRAKRDPCWLRLVPTAWDRCKHHAISDTLMGF